MDGSRFDALTKSFTRPGSRRRLIGGLVAGALGLVGLRPTEAATCRAAGNVCRENANCCSHLCGPKGADGHRRCACPAGTVACRGLCLDPATFATDPLNCGGCGVRCGAGQTCGGTGTPGACGFSGQGTCASGADSCAQAQAILCNDRANCQCYPTTAGATFCADVENATCSACTTDGDCTAVTGAGSRCLVIPDGCPGCPATGGRACGAPCAPPP